MKQRTRWMRTALCSVFVATAMIAAGAQDTSSGSISGTITDSTGAAIKGATVNLVNTDRGATVRTVTTNGSGFYTATNLPLGTYTVQISDQGFKSENVKNLVLHVSDALTVNHSLAAGSTGESVTVEANQVQLNLQDATSAGLINSTQINQLTMVSRNYESLMNLQPGVAYGGATDVLQRGPVGVNGASSVVNFSVNGGRDTSNNWTIDGADNVDRGANLTLYVYPSPDSIAEFKTLRGQYSAQYGRNSAGQVDVVTKSGTNVLHGSAYEYFRNDYFDANTYLNNFNGGNANPKFRTPKYRYNDFGFTLGGPVILPHIYNGKDKTFWFVSENWLKEITYTSGTGFVPTAAERKGDFSNDWYQVKNSAGQLVWTQGPVNVCTAFTYNPSSQTNTCTASGTQVTNISPTAQAYLKDVYSIIPTPNEAANAALGLDPHTITTTLPNQYPNLDTVVRIDQQIGQKLNFMYRYIHDTFPDFIGAGTFVAVPIPGLSGTVSDNPGTQHLAKATFVVSPTLVADIGYTYSNGSILTIPQGALLSAASPDIKVATPYTNIVGLVPTLSFSTLTQLGGSAVYNDHGINHQAFGDVTKTLRNHTLIAGVSYDHYEKTENNATSGNQGTFAFTNDAAFSNVTPPAGTTAASAAIAEDVSFSNFLTGNANNGFSQASTNNKIDINMNVYEFYVQDNWKVSPRLTLNLGARYTYDTPYQDDSGLLQNFDPATYSASKAPTIGFNGLICGSTFGSTNCGSSSPNPNANYVGTNYINGLIFGTPSAKNNNQTSPYGKYVNSVQKINLAPRFGWAYDVFGNGKTAFRGGYGWAYDELETSYWETTDWGNPPAIATYSQLNAALDNPSGGGTSSTPSATPARIQAVPLHLQTPYMQQYSMDVQQQLTPSFMLDVGYFGTHGTHLAGAEEIDQPVPNAWRGVLDPRNGGGTTSTVCTIPGYSGPAFTATACDNVLNQIKPYLGYNAIDAMRTIFSSNYNGLQVKATKKFSGRTYVDANFTWSRDLTNSPADYSGFIQNIYNVNGDYGRASDDRKLILNLDGVWELPWYREQHGFKGHLIGGWEISSIYSAATGLPLTVSASGGGLIQNSAGFPTMAPPNNPTNEVNDNVGLGVLGSTNAGLRPNQIGDPRNGNGIALKRSKAYEQSLDPWFNTGAFQAQDPAATVPGTAKRGSIDMPGYQTLDLGVFRNFRIWENLTFQFRAEAFNAANHTNVNTVSGSSTSTLFGTVTGYRDPRILQFAGRFDF